MLDHVKCFQFDQCSNNTDWKLCVDQPTEGKPIYPPVRDNPMPTSVKEKSKTTTAGEKKIWSTASAEDLNSLSHKTTSTEVTFLSESRVKAWMGWVSGRGAHRTQNPTKSRHDLHSSTPHTPDNSQRLFNRDHSSPVNLNVFIGVVHKTAFKKKKIKV